MSKIGDRRIRPKNELARSNTLFRMGTPGGNIIGKILPELSII
jgi:hypothetical protein